MNLEQIQKEKKAISPIIATLLLILIAIAAGVIVYAYVVGFIGGSTSNSGGSTSVTQITNFCVSATTKCNGADSYLVVVQNTGSVSITLTGSIQAQLYFTDITSGNTVTAACTATGTIAPGQSYTCSSATSNALSNSAGDSISLKVVNPDGGATTSSTKAIG